MRPFPFTLIFDLSPGSPPEDVYLKAIYESGCTDCRGGIGDAKDQLAVFFYRFAETLEDAIRSAVVDVVIAMFMGLLDKTVVKDDMVAFSVQRGLAQVAQGRCALDWAGRKFPKLEVSVSREDGDQHSLPLLPITQELKDRIEKLVGPIEEIDIDPDKPIEDDET